VRASLGCDRLFGGFFDTGRLPCAGCLDEGGEEGAREGADGVGAFGVPLDGDHELIGRVELDGFDDSVVGGYGADAEIVADPADGLMVAGIDLGRFGAGREKPGQARIGGNADGVGLGDGAAGSVIDRGIDLGFEVLEQGAIAPDVERLGAMADGEDGLAEIEGILQEELIDGSAAGIGGAALGDAYLAKPLRVNVIAAAREENAVYAGEQAGDAVGALVEGDEEGGGSGGVERGDVGRQGALIVFGVAAGRFGDGDADGHRRIV
jgi:hypothetical protein